MKWIKSYITHTNNLFHGIKTTRFNHQSLYENFHLYFPHDNFRNPAIALLQSVAKVSPGWTSSLFIVAATKYATFVQYLSSPTRFQPTKKKKTMWFTNLNLLSPNDMFFSSFAGWISVKIEISIYFLYYYVLVAGCLL